MPLLSAFSAERIERFGHCLELLGLSLQELQDSQEELVLESQTEQKQKNPNCALDFYIHHLCLAFDKTLPSIKQEKTLLCISKEPCIEALNDFWMDFCIYLREDSINQIKSTLARHCAKVWELIAKTHPHAPHLHLPCCCIGITLLSITKDHKHIGQIDLLLKKMGFCIVYLCHSIESYWLDVERVGESLVIVGDMIYYDVFLCDRVILSTLSPMRPRYLQNTAIMLYLGHVFNERIHYLNWKKKQEHCFNHLNQACLANAQILCAHTQNEYKLLVEVCNHYQINPQKIIQAGNPSLDWALPLASKLPPKQKEYLLLAPSHLHSFFENLEMVEMFCSLLSKGQKIVLRLHHCFRESEYKRFGHILQKLKQYPTFFLDQSKGYASSYLHKCFCILSDGSSMGLSYPLLFLVPAIIFMPDARALGLKLSLAGGGQISLYDEKLCFIAHEPKAIKEAILTFQDSKTQARLREEILSYRNEQVFHLGRSEEFLAHYISHLATTKGAQ